MVLKPDYPKNVGNHNFYFNWLDKVKYMNSMNIQNSGIDIGITFLRKFKMLFSF
jgi:hypothetical protein